MTLAGSTVIPNSSNAMHVGAMSLPTTRPMPASAIVFPPQSRSMSIWVMSAPHPAGKVGTPSGIAPAVADGSTSRRTKVTGSQASPSPSPSVSA